MNKADKIAQLRKMFGVPEEKQFDPEVFLLKLGEQISASNLAIEKGLENISLASKDSQGQQLKVIEALIQQLGQMNDLHTELKQAIADHRIEKVEVTREVHIPPKDIKVSVEQLPMDNEQRGFWQKLADGFKAPTDGLLGWLQETLLAIQKPEGAIAVRLVTKDQQAFYNAVFTAVSGGVSVSTSAIETLLTTLNGKGIYTATMSSTIDGRKGIDTEASSIAVKNFISESSLNTPAAGHFPLNITTNTSFDSGWIDTQGYGAIILTAVDNTGGGSPFTLEEHWSTDNGVSDIYQSQARIILVGDLATGGEPGPANFGQKRTIQMRYVRYLWTQETVAATKRSQDTGPSPNFTLFVANLVPIPIAFDVNVTNLGLAVVGPQDAATSVPLLIGGFDSIASPISILPALASSIGEISVQGIRTSWTGTPLVVAGKLATASTAATVAVAATSTQVLASQTTRMGFTIYNDSSQIVYIKKGTAASATSFDWILEPYDQLEVITPGYSGVIHHISGTAQGNLRVSSW